MEHGQGRLHGEVRGRVRYPQIEKERKPRKHPQGSAKKIGRSRFPQIELGATQAAEVFRSFISMFSTRVIVPPRGRVAMSGDIFICYKLGSGTGI